jgi:hypothetical protein
MLVSNIVSSKTLHEKNLLVKTHERKEYNVKHSTGSIIQEVSPWSLQVSETSHTYSLNTFLE